MFKKKRLPVTILLLLSLVLSSCTSAAKPESTIDKFFSAMKKFDMDKMADQVNTEKDDLDDYIKEDEVLDEMEDFYEEVSKKIEYNINDVDIKDDKALAKVWVKYIESSEILSASIMDMMKESIGMALGGLDLDDDYYEDLFRKSFNKNRENLEETFSEKDIDISLEKIDGDWLISEINDDLLNVMTANLLSTMKMFDENINPEAQDTKAEDIVNLTMDEKFLLANLEVKINGFEEKESVKSEFSEELKSNEGAKFILVDMDIKNISKESKDIFGDDFELMDEENRVFEPESDAIFHLDNYMNSRSIGAGLTENGVFLFQVPKESKEFSFMIKEEENNRAYIMKLK